MAENKKSPIKAWWLAPAIIGGVMAAGAIGKARRRDRANQAELKKYQAEFDERLKTYEKSKFKPLDPDLLRQENLFEGQENIFEELEVDTEAADYAKEQFQQQQANIMQGMKGVAGASGIAGLAQALSGQAAKQARESQLTIGQQLQQNRKMKLQEESRLNEQVRREQIRLNEQNRQIQIANMEGRRQFKLDKMTTLMGVAGQKIAGVQGAIAGRQQMYGQIASAVGQVAGSIITGSDRKLKKDINLIGESPSGLNIYSFKYINTKFGEGTYQGVMSDEIPSYAIIQSPDGYDMVDYSKIDVNFKQI